jgi:4-hydroxy-2-oxoheptanedioate aldolase
MSSSLRGRLHGTGALLGTFVKTCDPLIVEVLASSGFDVLVVDLEHSSLGLRDLVGLQRGADLHACPTLVRLPPSRLADAGRALEAGAHGIQVSSVGTVDDVRAARQAIRFAPDGDLGLSLTHRASGFGRMTASEYMRWVAEQTVLITQVESSEGLRALPAMLELADGPPHWFFGPTDLSASLGHSGDAKHPEVRSALERAAGLVREAGQAFGLFVATQAEAERWRALGASLVLIGADLSLLGEHARAVTAGWGQTSGSGSPDRGVSQHPVTTAGCGHDSAVKNPRNQN